MVGLLWILEEDLKLLFWGEGRDPDADAPVFIITWVVARLTFFLNPAHDMMAVLLFVVVILLMDWKLIYHESGLCTMSYAKAGFG